MAETNYTADPKGTFVFSTFQSTEAGSKSYSSGPGVPSSSLGGSMYWDETGKDFYVKDGGTWKLIVNSS